MGVILECFRGSVVQPFILTQVWVILSPRDRLGGVKMKRQEKRLHIVAWITFVQL